MLSLFYWLLALFLINLGLFIFVLTHERRSMWAGLTLTSTLMFLAFLAVDFLIVVDTRHPEQHHLISGFLLLVAVGIALFIFAFVFLLIAIFLYNGIKILIKEGTRWTNFLSLGTGIVIILLIFAYPAFGRFNSAPWFRFIYLRVVLVKSFQLTKKVQSCQTRLVNILIEKSLTRLNYPKLKRFSHPNTSQFQSFKYNLSLFVQTLCPRCIKAKTEYQSM